MKEGKRKEREERLKNVVNSGWNGRKEKLSKAQSENYTGIRKKEKTREREEEEIRKRMN